ncbi:MAG TPA: peptide chain release factor N(5)-glutamine methyltransferase [Ktedonobacteraceae bacterium]|nr:peptide chain release factor N(5)-glutamine methyltransferase [Ktedonobacteraceae bacterium]
MTIKDGVEQGAQILMRAQLTNARREAQVLLSAVLGVERATVYAYPEREVTAEQAERFFQLVARRAEGEPVAYLLGSKEFFGRDFYVDRRVLIPRPETEILVEAALAVVRRKLSAGQVPLVADIGTGSGAIPITIAVEEPRLPYLYACDISSDALAVAYLNCVYHHVEGRVRLLQGDLLGPLPAVVDLLTANLPYVGIREMATLERDVKDYEPHQALFSGTDGLDLLQRLCKDALRSDMLKPGAVMLLEIGYQQREPLTQLLHEFWPQATITYQKDYAGWDRLLQLAL